MTSLATHEPPARPHTARRANLTPKTDTAIFAAYANFEVRHEDMKAKTTAAAMKGSRGDATAEERREHRAFERAVTAHDKQVRAIVEMPAATLAGMLAKIQAAGAILECAGREYEPDLRKPWKRVNRRFGNNLETDLLLSLRADLLRMAKAEG